MTTYFARSCAYYMRLTDKQSVAARCRAKYERGVNLVAVERDALGSTFAPEYCAADPSRIFLTYDRLVDWAFVGGWPDEFEAVRAALQQRIASYDPNLNVL